MMFKIKDILKNYQIKTELFTDVISLEETRTKPDMFGINPFNIFSI